MERYVIYGPPGTGKSTEIVKRVNDYINIDKVSPSEIGLCSYTKAAAEVLAKKSGIKSKFVGTLHSLAFKQSGCIYEQTITYLKLKEFEIISGIEFTGGNPDDSSRELSNGDYYLALYGLHIARLGSDPLATYDASDRPGTREQFIYFIEAYEKWKDNTGFIDFNDMLRLSLFAENPDIKILFIDEAQDLSPLQWKIITKWATNIPIIHVAGDDDQAIYEWAGADPNGMYAFEIEHSAKRQVLDQSHRIPAKVHEKAHEIILNVANRVDKPYKAREAEGSINYYTDIEQINYIEHGDDILILYRNHSMREEAENMLITRCIPYTCDNGSPGLCQNWYWKLIKLYKKIQKAEADTYMMKPTEMKLLKQGLVGCLQGLVGTHSIVEVFNEYEWKEALYIRPDIVVYFEQLEKIDEDLNIIPTIHLSTIHGSKGREADRVILFNGMGAMSAERVNDGILDSEARVFYVGVTRTREMLDIVIAENSMRWLC